MRATANGVGTVSGMKKQIETAAKLIFHPNVQIFFFSNEISIFHCMFVVERMTLEITAGGLVVIKSNASPRIPIPSLSIRNIG